MDDLADGQLFLASDSDDAAEPLRLGHAGDDDDEPLQFQFGSALEFASTSDLDSEPALECLELPDEDVAHDDGLEIVTRQGFSFFYCVQCALWLVAS